MIALFIMIAINLIAFGMEVSKHGQEKEGKHNANTYFIALIVTFILYYYAFNQ